MNYEGQDYRHLLEFLSQNLGNNINFDNGCFLSLKDDNGFIWGTDPYGQDWGCNLDDGWESKIKSWLEYWDESRDEWGQLCDIGYQRQ